MSGDIYGEIRRARQGDREAAGKLVEENAGLIWSVARRYFGRGIDPEDLYQLGCVGFLKAIEGFDESFYRGIMPGLVAVGAGLVLVFLLMYFILSLYVNPLFRISNALDNFLSTGKRYSVTFEGDDQIANINNAVTEITEENLELKRRISVLKHSAQAVDKKEEE